MKEKTETIIGGAILIGIVGFIGWSIFGSSDSPNNGKYYREDDWATAFLWRIWRL